MIEKADFRFIGIGEFALVVPGIDSKECSANPDHVYTLPGTSDQQPTEKLRKLQADAKIVARQYNLIIKRHLVDAGIFRSWLECNVPVQRGK